MTRRREREARKDNGTALIKGVGDTGEDTDNESISTFVFESDMDNTSDDGTKDDITYADSNAKKREFEAPSSKDSDEDDERFRYKAVMRVPWLNRKSRVEEWGFHCVGCEGCDQWPDHANRDFIMSTFREHLKECGPIRAGVHHIDDCCEKGTCKKKREDNHRTIYDRPFWRS